jgi:5-methyltetrahydropteroyltriglutamate--homocysteine methyltransferase
MAVVDDIGSFPLPGGTAKVAFDAAYPGARDATLDGQASESADYRLIQDVVLESFERKVGTGLDIITYPQHYDMHKQFLEPIEFFQRAPFFIDERKAILPEIEIIKNEGKKLAEKAGRRIALRSCVTGPIELYLRTEFGTNIYREVLENLAKSVNVFLKNSIVNTPHLKTEVLCIDEPSLGFSDLLNIERDDLIDVLELSLKGIKLPVQIHLHTLKSTEIALETEGLTTITGEFAASPQNIGLIKKRDLQSHDMFLRAGVTRTNIDSIIAEYHDRGVEPKPSMLIDSKSDIKKRIRKIDATFGETVSTWGPDCGLGSWPTQEVAAELLKRTTEAVKESFK